MVVFGYISLSRLRSLGIWLPHSSGLRCLNFKCSGETFCCCTLNCLLPICNQLFLGARIKVKNGGSAFIPVMWRTESGLERTNKTTAWKVRVKKSGQKGTKKSSSACVMIVSEILGTLNEVVYFERWNDLKNRATNRLEGAQKREGLSLPLAL